MVQALVPSIFGAYCRALLRDEPANAVAAPARADAGAELSDREIQILRWVRDGKSNQEIGVILSISPLTVKNHVQNIMKKLKVKTRGHAVTRGLKMGLLMSHNEIQGEEQNG